MLLHQQGTSLSPKFLLIAPEENLTLPTGVNQSIAFY